ncbi:hypothetical protein Ddye_025884 [Dipteronia dyeriana]|uniref:Uncharacterized protein n=1 Tax=Dipteronia dyeriana TaxID=168575 RepID=A0AAD9TM11_9ROSI|nr:hypothetical protein Ddye_025884 [Dipteronia dyeriana]
MDALDWKKEVAQVVYRLCITTKNVRIVVSEGAIEVIIKMIHEEIAATLVGLQENVITTMLNLAICVDNNRVIGEHPSTILLLANSLKAGTLKIRRNDA